MELIKMVETANAVLVNMEGTLGEQLFNTKVSVIPRLGTRVNQLPDGTINITYPDGGGVQIPPDAYPIFEDATTGTAYVSQDALFQAFYTFVM